MPKVRALYQLKVDLLNIEPAIWRRIQVWEDITLAQLHTTLQMVIAWEDYHLHEFVIGRRTYGMPDPDNEREVIDERSTILAEVVPSVGSSFEYLYDFGDSWQHHLLLEAILLPDAKTSYPICVAGERSAPPEDVGGPPGYEQYLDALANSKHAEHKNLLKWRGPFDAEAFSLIEINARLRKKFRAKKPTKASASGAAS